MSFHTASVTDLVSAIKGSLEDQFDDVAITGEVSNLSHSSSGHWYFTLSDESSSISCALFRGDALRNPLIQKLKDGSDIIVMGSVGVYQRRGTFQVIAKKILLQGEGKLKLKFEQLKKRLAQEGLFDIGHKKPIPQIIKRLAVITALRGAALQDFLNVYKRRATQYSITIIPALVQGEKAHESLIKAIDLAHTKEFDVIVLTRGGGSIEDLWAFNEELLVRRIYKSTIPIVSAVGHQVDFTLSDYVSDLRLETPTAAAEVLSEGQLRLSEKLNFLARSLKSAITLVQDRIQKLSPLRWKDKMTGLLAQQKFDLSVLGKTLLEKDLLAMNEKKLYLDDLTQGMKRSLQLQHNERVHQLKRIEVSLRSLNPENVLGRGYSYLTHKDVALTSLLSLKKVPKNDSIEVHLQDGVAKVWQHKE